MSLTPADVDIPTVTLRWQPPGRPLVSPLAFPAASAFAAHSREAGNGDVASGTTTGAKRTREEDDDGHADPSHGMSRLAATVPPLASPPFGLLEASRPTLQLTSEVLAKVSETLTAAASPATGPSPASPQSQNQQRQQEGQITRSSSLVAAANAFSSLESAESYFADLYSTPEKQERDTRRPVDYEASIKVIRANTERDNVDECVSCLTRGQHAHYTPGLQTVYTIYGTRAPLWKSTALNPDAATVAELVEAEQAEMKAKLMFAVCSCPRCRWHAPVPRAVAPPPSAKSMDEKQLPAEDDGLVFAEVGDDDTRDADTDEGAPTATSAQQRQSRAPRHKKPARTWRRRHEKASPPLSLAASWQQQQRPRALDSHEHLNYNYLNQAHVEAFARRRRFHRTKHRVVAFLLCAARECEWLARVQQEAEAEAGPSRDGNEMAAEMGKQEAKETACDATRTTNAQDSSSLREDHVMRLTADQFAERYRTYDTRTESPAMVTADSLRKESVHSDVTTVTSVRVTREAAPLPESPGVGKATGKGRQLSKKPPAVDGAAVAVAEQLPRRLYYERLDGVLAVPELDADDTHPDNAEESGGAAAAAFLTRWQRNVDTHGTLHTPRTIPISAVTRATARTLFTNAAAIAGVEGPSSPRFEAVKRELLSSSSGVSLTFDKRALHALLSAHTTDSQAFGKGGFRLPVRVRLSRIEPSPTTTTAGAVDEKDKGLVLHVEVGDPFPRPFETRRDIQTAAARLLLRGALLPSCSSSSPSAVEQGGGTRPRCCAEVVLARNGNTNARASAAARDGAPSSDEVGVVAGNDSSPPTASLLPSSGVPFHVVASATATEPQPIFDMVKLDYLHHKGLGTHPAQGDGGAEATSVGIHTTLFTFPDPQSRAALPSSLPSSPPLLEAFTASESLELSMLFHCFPAATVRVHHVNAYTGAILHVDHLSNGNWQPLLLRRLTAITATLNPTQLAQQRERLERKLIAHAKRADAAKAAAAPAAPSSAAAAPAESTSTSTPHTLDPEAYSPLQTAANPLNAALFLPVKDITTAAALESLADVRYAWDCLYDVLANLCHQAVLGVAAQLCEKEAERAVSLCPSAVTHTTEGEEAEETFSFLLVKLSATAWAGPTRGRKPARHHHHQSSAPPRNKIELCLQDVAKVFPGMSLRFDPAREAREGGFIEPTSGAVCEREYGGLREWPFANRVPMTFPPREI